MKKKRLGEILLDAGAITPQQLAEALGDQKRFGGKLGNILLDRRYITEKEFFRALTSQLHIPAIDFTKSTIPEAVIKVLPQDLAEKHTVFPVALKNTPRGRILVLAMADPTNVSIQDEIQFTTGFKVEPALALDSTLRYVIREYFFDRLGRGSYRMGLSFDPHEDAAQSGALTTETASVSAYNGVGFQIQRERERDFDEPTLESVPRDEPEPEFSPQGMINGDRNEPAPSDRPVLTRELKTLLKLLHKKGIINPKEYLDEFFNTD